MRQRRKPNRKTNSKGKTDESGYSDGYAIIICIMSTESVI